MDPERKVRLIQDSQGRKLLVEVSGDVDIETTAAEDSEDMFDPVHVKDDIAKFTNSLNELISDTTSVILDSIATIKGFQPSKVQVEFGVGMGAEGQVWFIAKGSLNSTIKVSVEWADPKPMPVPEE